MRVGCANQNPRCPATDVPGRLVDFCLHPVRVPKAHGQGAREVVCWGSRSTPWNRNWNPCKRLTISGCGSTRYNTPCVPPKNGSVHWPCARLSITVVAINVLPRVAKPARPNGVHGLPASVSTGVQTLLLLARVFKRPPTRATDASCRTTVRLFIWARGSVRQRDNGSDAVKLVLKAKRQLEY